jgi:hypothetical protein
MTESNQNQAVGHDMPSPAPKPRKKRMALYWKLEFIFWTVAVLAVVIYAAFSN